MAFLVKVLEWIYPPKCMICSAIIPIYLPRWLCHQCKEGLEKVGESFCMKCGAPVEDKDTFCKECNRKKTYFIKNRSVFVYDRQLAKLIHRMKYGNHPQYAKGFAQFMLSCYANYFHERIDYIVAVPMYKSKQRKRGFNQADLMAGCISEAVHIPYNRNVLQRVKDTEAQSGLGAHERQANLKGVFAVNKKIDISNKIFLVIDDIYTTGSTMNECAKVLIENGAKYVYCFTLSIAIKKYE